MSPEPEQENEYVATERAALLGYKFAQGARLTTMEVAVICGLTHSGAWRILDKMSRVLPLLQLDDGKWVSTEHIAISSIDGC